MNECLNCKKGIEQKEGKREKKFCDDNCRSAYWQKNKKKEPKYVQFKTFQALKDKFDELCKEVKTDLQEKKAFKKSDAEIKQESVEKNTERKYEMSEQEKLERIKVLEFELSHPEKNPLIGQRKWIAVREKELNELKNKLI